MTKLAIQNYWKKMLHWYGTASIKTTWVAYVAKYIIIIIIIFVGTLMRNGYKFYQNYMLPYLHNTLMANGLIEIALLRLFKNDFIWYYWVYDMIADKYLITLREA